jgi:hypothetical protein
MGSRVNFVEKMRHKSVDSSLISSVAYDQRTSVLEIRFTNGRLYRYLMVPRDVHTGLMSSSSKGRFFVDEIEPRFPAVDPE